MEEKISVVKEFPLQAQRPIITKQVGKCCTRARHRQLWDQREHVTDILDESVSGFK